jgi:hypothetical protein
LQKSQKEIENRKRKEEKKIKIEMGQGAPFRSRPEIGPRPSQTYPKGYDPFSPLPADEWDPLVRVLFNLRQLLPSLETEAVISPFNPLHSLPVSTPWPHP